MHKTSHTIASAVAHYTTAPVQPGTEWLRPGDVRRTHGLSRSYIYELIAENKVISVVLRRNGRATGCRLISVSSLNAFIESHTA
jgi:hypothetical protein